MTMNFLPHEWVVDFKSTDLDDGFASRSGGRPSTRSTRPPRLLEGKLEIPRFDAILERPRLNDLLERSIEQFAATSCTYYVELLVNG